MTGRHDPDTGDERPSADDSVSGHEVAVPTARAVAERAVDVIDGSVEPRAIDARRPTAPARRNARVSPPQRNPQWLVNQLPVGMLGNDFFVRFVSIFQSMGETLMESADQVRHLADATVTPSQMLPYLASWIDSRIIDESLPEELQRTLLRSSARTLAWRGTRRGLHDYLAMLSGGDVEVIDGGGVWPAGEAPADAAWVRLQVEGTGHLSEDEFIALVRDEIPAHVRGELWINHRRVLNTGAGSEDDRGGNSDD